MSDVLTRIVSLRRELSGAEARVADYIKAHPSEAPSGSVNELAAASGVSVASVTRLAKRLGYSGLRELKISLARETSSPVSAIFDAIDKSDSDDEVVRKVFGGNVQSLQNTLKMLHLADCSKAARLIATAQRVMFFGIGTSGNVGHDAALRLSHLGIAAEACGDSYSMLIHAAHMKKGDIAVGISHSGRSTMTVEALATARANGAVTLGISNFLRSPLHKACDYFFCTSFQQTRVRSAAISAIPAQVCILDALYVLTARHRKSVDRNIEQINQLIENRFRIQGKR